MQKSSMIHSNKLNYLAKQSRWNKSHKIRHCWDIKASIVNFKLCIFFPFLRRNGQKEKKNWLQFTHLNKAYTPDLCTYLTYTPVVCLSVLVSSVLAVVKNSGWDLDNQSAWGPSRYLLSLLVS